MHGKVWITLLLTVACALSSAIASSAESDKQLTDKQYTNSIGMEFVFLPAGSFMMGSDPNSEESYDNENPLHKVSIGKPFYLGKYEVTQAQWEAVMGSNPVNS